jgi:hypothetical protein
VHQSFTARHNRRRWILHTVHTRVREGAIDASSREKKNTDVSSGVFWWRMSAAACWYAQEGICLLDSRSDPESSIAGFMRFSFSKIIMLGTDNAHGIHRQLTSSWPPFPLFFPPLRGGHGGLFLFSAFGMGGCFLFHKGFWGLFLHTFQASKIAKDGLFKTPQKV